MASTKQMIPELASTILKQLKYHHYQFYILWFFSQKLMLLYLGNKYWRLCTSDLPE